MATSYDITDFHKGEFVQFTLLAKDRDDTVITTPASQTVTMTIGTTADGSLSWEFSTATGHITLTDESTGEFTISLTPSDLISVQENSTYYYNIWTELSPSQPLLQAKGKFRLLKSIEAS